MKATWRESPVQRALWDRTPFTGPQLPEMCDHCTRPGFSDRKDPKAPGGQQGAFIAFDDGSAVLDHVSGTPPLLQIDLVPVGSHFLCHALPQLKKKGTALLAGYFGLSGYWGDYIIYILDETHLNGGFVRPRPIYRLLVTHVCVFKELTSSYPYVRPDRRLRFGPGGECMRLWWALRALQQKENS